MTTTTPHEHASPTPWAVVDRWFFAPIPALRLGALRALVCGLAIYDVLLYAVVFDDAANVTAGQPGRPWTPLYFMQVLGLEPLDSTGAHTLFLVAMVSLTAGALGVCSRLACAIGAVAFLWWTGLAYSFGKPHHDKVALAFVLAALPFARVGERLSVDAIVRAVWRAWRGAPPLDPDRPVNGLPLWLLQLSLAVGYCGAGAAKILLGGPDWFNGYTLQGIMLGHDGNWSRAFAAPVWFAQLQSIGVVATQVLFPLVLVWPASRWFFLPAATAFHLMTWQTMDTGPYMRVWLLLFAFVPLERVPDVAAGWLRGGFVRAALTLLLGGGYVVLVVAVAAEVVPAWALLAAGVPLGVAFWLRCLPTLRCRVDHDPARRGHRVAAALLDGLDWGGRCTFTATAERRFAVVDARGEPVARPWTALALRVPLALPFLPLLRVCCAGAR